MPPPSTRHATRARCADLHFDPILTTPDMHNEQRKTNTSFYYGFGAVAALIVLYMTSFGRTPSAPAPSAVVVKTATATVGGSEGVHGTVTFSQAVVGGVVTVKGHIKGLDADAKRGFHVHELGNLSGGCASAGAHYNPLGVAHGARSDTVRHAGDLGNIQADADGVANFEFEDAVLSLNGVFSIVGRTVMVHSGTDDLGRGGNDDSKKTGNAGGRSACGVIGVAELT